MTINDHACYILNKYSPEENQITPMKLQKLLYYIKVWGLVDGKNLIPENFVHQKYGPLNWEIYNKYKIHKSSVIVNPSHDVGPPEASNVVDFILENYMDFNAISLSSMTHSEDPWINTQLGETIDENLIYDYYSKLPFAKNFPLNPNNPFYPIMSDANHSFIFDMSSDDAQKSMEFSSYSEYLELKKKTQNELNKRLSIFAQRQ